MNNKSKEKHLYNVKLLLDTGKTDEAVSSVQEYIEQWEICEEVAILGGEAYMRKGAFDEAKVLIQQGLSKKGGSYELIFMLGQVYEAESNYKAASLCHRYALFLCNEEEDTLYINTYYKEFLNKNVDTSLPYAAILLYTDNNLEWLKNCIDTIKRYMPRECYEIIAIVPRPLSESHSEDQDNIRYVVSDNDEGLASVYNQVIDLTGSQTDILILAEDTSFLPHSIFQLQLAGVTIKQAGILSSLLYRGTEPRHTWYESRVLPDGPAYYIKREVIKTCGWFDDTFYSLRYLIADLGFRALNRGFGLYQCNHSLLNAGNRFQLWRDNRDEDLFYTKWNVHMSYSCFSRMELVHMITVPKDYSLRLLEVGCSCGATLLSIKEMFPQAKLYGIELDEGPARIAQNFANVETGNIENMELSFEPGSLDYILFADVLEHLRDPLAVLKRISSYLKSDGHIIASIPNVMHVSVVKPLLEGHWHYQDAGILDRTHLKFFTYAEVLSLFKDAGFGVVKVTATQIGISPEEEKFIQKAAELGHSSAKLFQVYQFLICASR